MKIFRLFTAFFLASSLTFGQTNDLRKQIRQYLKDKKATVGVAMHHFGRGDSLTINNAVHFPMQSTYKFHLGLAVLAQIDAGKWKLDDPIFVKKADLLPNTWSPMREAHPEGNVNLPLRRILQYTVSESDNNGCDLLFKMVGGPKAVDDYFKKMGIKNLAIKTNEYDMQKSWPVQFTNWTTPSATMEVLKKFYKGNILSKSSYDFLWKTMVETSTGPKRIKGLLPKNTIVAHKTGTSGTKDGVYSAINDFGIIMLPDGQAIGVLVFVAESREGEDGSQLIIAEISKMIWDFYSK